MGMDTFYINRNEIYTRWNCDDRDTLKNFCLNSRWVTLRALFIAIEWCFYLKLIIHPYQSIPFYFLSVCLVHIVALIMCDKKRVFSMTFEKLFTHEWDFINVFFSVFMLNVHNYRNLSHCVSCWLINIFFGVEYERKKVKFNCT